MGNRLVILSGGTATNNLVPLFSKQKFCVSYILPILDNGGSSSEIIRVIGGPAIGDLRSRLIQLIPDNQSGIRYVLGYRLDSKPLIAKAQWEQIVDGSHEMWQCVSSPTKEIIRSFLLHVHIELLKRSRICAGSSPGKQFKFEFASIGNLFLTAGRLFTGSLDAAIELFMKITDIHSSTEVLPCLNTNFSYHISAILSDGSVITGQSQISHPSIDPVCVSSHGNLISLDDGFLLEPGVWELDIKDESSDDEMGNTPLYIHPDLKKSQLHFHKTDGIEPLKSPIERIVYVSPYGEEICPSAQSKVILRLSEAEILVYSIGSLMTSIIPIVILKGVGRAIAYESSSSKKRVLLLNGSEDRETCGMSAFDYIKIIVELAQYLIKRSGHTKVLQWTLFVTHLLFLESSKIYVDIEALEAAGITCISVKQATNGLDEYDLEDLSAKFSILSQIN